MTAETDLYFTTIKLKFKFCLTILYGADCCGNSDEASDSMNDGDFLDFLSDNRQTEEKTFGINCEY
jgi:hypothetical protein